MQNTCQNFNFTKEIHLADDYPLQRTQLTTFSNFSSYKCLYFVCDVTKSSSFITVI